jgi:purine-binding chemotaxis protein CheW
VGVDTLVQTNPARVSAVAAISTADETQYLTFMLDREIFAIGILAIKEIIEYGNFTAVPTMPACIRGVINLRGAAVPIMDLSVRFGKPARDVTKRTCIVIVEIEAHGEQRVVGVIVDAVNAVVEIAPSEIEPPPAFGARIPGGFIEGMGKIGNRFVILLNVNHVLSADDMDALANDDASGRKPFGAADAP